MASLTKGWKGYLGAIGLIAIGLYLVSIGEKIAGAQAIFTGLGILGIRHKQSYEEEE